MTDPRGSLLAERADARRRVGALEREFAVIAEAASAGGTDDEHDPEGATLAFERHHTAALLEGARAQLAAIDAALERVRDGRYGRCDRCGQPIGDDRLAARPAALTCVRCAVLPGRPGPDPAPRPRCATGSRPWSWPTRPGWLRREASAGSRPTGRSAGYAPPSSPSLRLIRYAYTLR